MVLINNLFKHWTYQILSPGKVLREKYEAFKSLLNHDKRAHELMAELEEIYYRQAAVDFRVIETIYEAFSQQVSEIVKDLSRLCPTRYFDLPDYYKKFDSYVRYIFSPKDPPLGPPYAMSLADASAATEALAGGKAIHLAAIRRKLTLPVPTAFVISSNAFNHFLAFNHLREWIDAELAKLDIYSSGSLMNASRKLVAAILKARIPPEIAEAVNEVVHGLWPPEKDELRVAIRSSAVGEDSRATFAGQYGTVLNVPRKAILDAYKEVIASKYSPRAIYYRINYGLSDTETPMAVLGMEMIEAGASGVMYTIGPQDPDSEDLAVHSVWGLGELLVAGRTSSDIITLAKKGRPEIKSRKVGNQLDQLVAESEFGTEIKPLSEEKKRTGSLEDDAAVTLAEWGMALENYFGEPQDVEWCRDREGHLFLLQSRPLRTGKIQTISPVECHFEEIENEVLVSDGNTASGGIGAGRVHRAEKEKDLDSVAEGSVLVARNASPRYVRVMNRLNGVVTETGSVAGHFASMAREFGVPVLVNAAGVLRHLEEGMEVTVHAEGGKVYRGLVPSLLESPCARRNLIADSPFMRRLSYVMEFVSTLRLTDPRAKIFRPGGCRSMHDIIRFCHEKAVQEMFHLGNRRVRKIGGSRKLQMEIPMLFHVFDVGDGLKEDAGKRKTVGIEEITCVPMRAVLKGLSHPAIQWGDFTHFDWAEHDRIVMGGGIISPDSAMFASHAVVSGDYANLNLRFGYHFVILDTVCGNTPEDNYILFRFSGGGADYSKRMLRADFLARVLASLSFEVSRKSDLIDAEFHAGDLDITVEKLDMLGRLLGASRLLDMYLKDERMVDTFASDFLNGRYHFGLPDN